MDSPGNREGQESAELTACPFCPEGKCMHVGQPVEFRCGFCQGPCKRVLYCTEEHRLLGERLHEGGCGEPGHRHKYPEMGNLRDCPDSSTGSSWDCGLDPDNCAFCGKHRSEVYAMIRAALPEGDDAYTKERRLHIRAGTSICNQCVGLGVDIINKKVGRDAVKGSNGADGA